MSKAYPDLKLSGLLSTVKNPKLSKERQDEAKDELLKQIEQRELAPLYKHVTQVEGITTYNAALHDKMAAKNAEHSAKLRKAIDEATEAEDDTAVVDAWVALGNWYTELCDRAEAESTLRKAFELTASVGSKIDIVLTIVRLGFFFNDRALLKKELDHASQLIERGGDWERKNKYKTYRGLFAMSVRQFSEAADLLIDSFATFTCTELLSYEEVVSYGVLCGALALDRVDLKKRIVDSPEVLSLLPSTKSLEPLTIMTNSLYTGEYATFLRALVDVDLNIMRPSPYASLHSGFYVREMRCKAYSQLLESYMSLNLKSMASTFGVSEEYLESDLARLIPQKKLNCIVDKVNGVVVTNRPDTKNAQYQLLVRQGDALLTKLQKYGAAVRLYGADDAI